MFHTESTRLALALALTCCTLATLVSVGAEQASASTGCNAAPGFNLELGISNSCNFSTHLSGAATTGLSVTTSASLGIAIKGVSSAAGSGWGVMGEASSSAPSAYGVEGRLLSTGPSSSAGVFGESASTTANGPGVWGFHYQSSGNAPGVLGQTSASAANAAGVKGTISSSADYSAGVRGENNAGNCCGFGVVGLHAGQGIGVGGYAPNGFGVFGWSPNNWAAWLDGAVTVTKDLHVNGTLYKSSGAFRIDNPTDPGHSYLQHSFVESPDMKNIYDGNATTNAKGFATVMLPRWFQALNRDFRYQLTIVGTRGWRARVVKEVAHDQFTIQTDVARVKVSWQVTGIRHDPYANAHRIQTVVPKTGSASRRYEHPELYGQPQSKSVDAAVGPPTRLPKLHAPTLPNQK